MAPATSPEPKPSTKAVTKPPVAPSKPSKPKSTSPTNKSPFDGIKQEDLRQISSLSPECNEIKKQYDECFNEWFATKFLVEKQSDMAPCAELLKQYTACVKGACTRLGISISGADCPAFHTGGGDGGQKHVPSTPVNVNPTANKSTQTQTPSSKANIKPTPSRGSQPPPNVPVPAAVTATATAPSTKAK